MQLPDLEAMTFIRFDEAEEHRLIMPIAQPFRRISPVRKGCLKMICTIVSTEPQSVRLRRRLG